MKRKINQLVSDYNRGRIGRREFMKKMALLAVGTTASADIISLSGSCAGKSGRKDAELENGFITYPGHTGEVRAYLSVPAGKKKYPAVIIIHENRGLVPHIMDVNRRMAGEGFLALAPDALSPLGGTPQDDPDRGRTLIGQLDREDTVKDFVAAVKYLKTHPRSTGKVGCTGFCWGGGMTNQVAVNAPDLDAAAPYYGAQPDPAEVPKIKAPVMAHYAGDDPRINAGIEAFEEAMKKAGIEYQIFIYEGARHAFNNDSNPDRYHPAAARLAWERTVQFFKEKLGEGK